MKKSLGGFNMKTINKIILPLAMIIAVSNVFAQDDFYSPKKKKNKEISIETTEQKIDDSQYTTAPDYIDNQNTVARETEYNKRMGITDSTTYYEDENGDVRITNNYYNSDNYDYNNEYYDYEYSSRIKRFHRPYSGYGYYSDCYTNYYWYDYNPYNFGVSVYSSYGWWYPRPWGWNVGWSWGNGWYTGFGYGGGWGSPYGYYGSSYWGNYYNGYGYNNGYYASNYYNSYDHNSNYYGHRGGSSGYAGYGSGTRPSGSSISHANSTTTTGITEAPKTFGEKYESAIKNTTSQPRINHGSSENGVNNSTRSNTNLPNINSNPKPGLNQNNGTRSNTNLPTINSNPKPELNQNNSSKEVIIPRTSSEPGIINSKPRMSNDPRNHTPNTKTPIGPAVVPTTPRTTNPSTQPNYNKPRNNNLENGNSGAANPKPRPRTYSNPTKPTVNPKPNNQDYSKPNNSYSRPAGNSFNRGGTGTSGGGGTRKPR